MRPHLALALPFVLALAPAAAQEPPALDAFAARLVESWEAAWAAGDLDALAALYAPAAELFFDEVPRVVGRDGIRAAWASDIVEGGATLTELTPLTISGGMDAHVVEGTYAIVAGGHAGPTGRFLQIWTFTPAGWLIDREVWIPDVFRPSELEAPGPLDPAAERAILDQLGFPAPPPPAP